MVWFRKKKEIVDINTLKENEEIETKEYVDEKGKVTIDRTKIVYVMINEVKQNFVFGWFKRTFLCGKSKLLVAINYPTIIKYYLINIKKGWFKVAKNGYHIQDDKTKPTNTKYKLAFYDFGNPNPIDLIHEWITGKTNTNSEQLQMYMEAELVSKSLRAKRKTSVLFIVLLIVGILIFVGVAIYMMYYYGVFGKK